MRKILFSIFIVLSLSACGLLATSDKAAEAQYKETANEVLVAVNRYTEENGAAPKSLRELMPKYLKSLPEDLEVRYNTLTSTLYFSYSTGWHRMGLVTCSVKAGELDWFCERTR